jgi:hypothetical protein
MSTSELQNSRNSFWKLNIQFSLTSAARHYKNCFRVVFPIVSTR